MDAHLDLINQRKTAIVRLSLGLLEMAGSAFSIALVWGSGINPVSLTAISVTCFLTALSVVLFGRGGSTFRGLRPPRFIRSSPVCNVPVTNGCQHGGADSSIRFATPFKMRE